MSKFDFKSRGLPELHGGGCTNQSSWYTTVEGGFGLYRGGRCLNELKVRDGLWMEGRHGCEGTN